MGVQAFTVHVGDEALEDLRTRLAAARWPAELAGVGWSRGVPGSYLKPLAEYWRTQYDWRKAEAKLNELPHFVTVIDGQPIHFLHVRSPEPGATPLMLIHGWPSSFLEFLPVIGPLTDPRSHGADPEQAFHLVIPSVPGFAFSTPLREAGWHHGRIAAAFVSLMTRLGYQRFGVQGGDTGAFIATEMGRTAPRNVIGVHVNALFAFPSGDEGELDGLTEVEQQRLAAMGSFNDGYMQIQWHSPQTLAYGLNDSPIGQLAWIMEQFHAWTNSPSGAPEDVIDRDLLLTNVSLYWFSGSAGSSAQVYFEARHNPQAWEPRARGVVPTGVLVSTARDMTVRRFVERDHNVVHWSEYDEGGHFFALEAPSVYVEDVRTFFARHCR